MIEDWALESKGQAKLEVARETENLMMGCFFDKSRFSLPYITFRMGKPTSSYL